jgi:hypothetical protein
VIAGRGNLDIELLCHRTKNMSRAAAYTEGFFYADPTLMHPCISLPRDADSNSRLSCYAIGSIQYALRIKSHWPPQHVIVG